MILFPLNTEFDIEIKYPYTFNFPMLEIRSKNGDIISHNSLADVSIKKVFEDMLSSDNYKDSVFLKRAITQNSI